MNLAPIGVSTYTRLNHLKQTINALQTNTLAQDSELYIFSDAPKKGDEADVLKVRKYIHTINGFKKVHIIEREHNGRVANSRGGLRYLLERYGKAIFLEDDIVTASGFLKFLNEGLEFYKNNKSIVTISGYTPPIVYKEYAHDILFLQRHNSWGMGIWMDRMEKVEKYIDRLEYEININKKPFFKKVITNGEDILDMLELEVNKKIDALDVKIMYYQALNDWFTVMPKKSLVQNIGHDGTGVHCTASDKFYHKELWNKVDGFHFIENIFLDKKIMRENKKFRSARGKRKLIFLAKKLGLHQRLKSIKERL